MPRYNHRNGSLWRFSLYGTKLEELGHSPKLISPQFVRPLLKAIKTTLSTPKLFVKLHRAVYAFCAAQNGISAGNAGSARVRESLVQDKVKTTNQMHAFCWNLALAFPEELPLLAD